jgi:hypothetical protein
MTAKAYEIISSRKKNTQIQLICWESARGKMKQDRLQWKSAVLCENETREGKSEKQRLLLAAAGGRDANKAKKAQVHA